MDVKNLIPGRKRTAEMQALREAVRVQGLLIDDVVTAQKATQTYVGNAYQTYQKVITELAKKYEGKAEWGTLQTGNIIDVRSAFIIGQGLTIAPADPEDKDFADSSEKEFIDKFLDFNDLDREMCQELAKEAEIEGCILFDLSWDAVAETVRLNYISRVDTKYTITTAPLDKFDYIQASWTPTEDSKPIVLEKEKFVYSRFGGRVHKQNEPYPKVGKALNEIDSIARALRDWREINHLFAAPVPTIEAKDEASAKAIDAALGGMNWKIRKQIVMAGGKMVFAQPNLQGGSEALEKEIVALAKMISGTTGVPVHFLGLPDLMSNRATADNLMELVSASTSKERQIWIGTYEEMISKAIAIYNAESKFTKLDPERATVSIPFVTAAAWQLIKDVWLPMFLANSITLKTFLKQVPGIKAEEEAVAVAEQEAQQLASLMPQPAVGQQDAGVNQAGNANPADTRNPAANLKAAGQQVKNYKRNPGDRMQGAQ
jgi:hypothetical protein